MRSRKRAAARLNIDDYPSEYTQLLLDFQDRVIERHEPYLAIGPLTRKGAAAARARMHYFLGILRNTPNKDQYLGELNRIGSLMTSTLALLSGSEDRGDARYALHWQLNPLVAAIRHSDPQKEFIR
jgi:hypothetical protein